MYYFLANLETLENPEKSRRRMASAALMVPARQSFSTASKLLRSIGANRKAVAFDSGVLGDCGTDPALLQQRLEASDQGSENVFSGHRALRTSHQMDQRRDIRAGSDGRRVLFNVGGIWDLQELPQSVENLSRRCISTVTATRRRSTLSFIRMVSFRR